MCGFKAKKYKKCNRELHGGCNNNNSQDNTSNVGSSKTNVGSNKTCNFCGLKANKEAGFFNTFPKKAPVWYKEKTTKAKTSSSSMEVSLATLDPEKLGIDTSMLQGKGNDTFTANILFIRLFITAPL